MKKESVFVIVAIFFALTAVLLIPNFSPILAQNASSSGKACTGNTPGTTVGCNPGEVCLGSEPMPGAGGYGGGWSPGKCFSPEEATQLRQAEENKLQCNFVHPTGCPKWLAAWGVSLLLYLTSLILIGVGGLFNIAFRMTILNFATLAKMSGISLAWTLGRDFANIFFIFILLFAALNQVLGIGWFDTKKIVVKVIIIALLINFSAIFPKVIIDTSNILANIFYQQIGVKNAQGDRDLAGVFVRSANPNILLTANKDSTSQFPTSSDQSQPVNVGETNISWSSIFAVGLGTLVLMIVVAYALIILTFLMFSRTVILLFLIALSSLAVFSYILPATAGQFRKWFGRLIEEAFFAPAALFLLFIVSKIVTNNDFITMTTGSAGFMEKISGYIVVIGMVLASVFIARQFSKYGASVADKVKNRGRTWGIGLAGGTAAYSVGRVAARVANSETMKNIAAKSPRVGSLVRSAASGIANAKFGTKASFREREAARAKSLAGRMEDLSETQKLQYTQNLKAPGIGSRAYDWVRGGPSQELLYRKGLNEEDRGRLEKESQLSRRELRGEELQKKKNDPKTPLTTEEQAELATLQPEVNSAKAKRLAQTSLEPLRAVLKGKDKTQAEIERFKGMKTPGEQLDALVSTNLKSSDRAKILGGLGEGVVAKMRMVAAGDQTKLSMLDEAAQDFELEKQNKIAELEGKATDSQAIETLKTQFKELAEARGAKNTVKMTALGNSLKVAIQNRKRGTISNLGADHIEELLKDRALLAELGKSGVIEMERNKSLTEKQRSLFRETVEDGATAPGVDPATQKKLQEMADIVQKIQDPNNIIRMLSGPNS